MGLKSTIQDGGEAELVSAVQSFRQTFAQALQEHRNRAVASVADDRAKIEKARKLVTSTGIGTALVTIWCEVQHYPSWSQNNGWHNYNPLNVEDVGGYKASGTQSRGALVSFRLGGHAWSLMHETKYDNEAKLTFGWDGNDVFAIDISRPSHGEYDDWHYSDVTALKLGEWVTYLVEAELNLHQRSQTKFADAESERVRVQASKIDL